MNDAPIQMCDDNAWRGAFLQRRRDAVLNHHDQFKDFAMEKRERLEEARRFLYFKRETDEFEIWMREKLETIPEENSFDIANLQTKIQKHEVFKAEVQANSKTLNGLDENGAEMISEKNFNSDLIKKRLEELHALWEKLFYQIDEKATRLRRVLVMQQFIRQCDDILYWIHEEEKTLETIDTSAESVEDMQLRFDSFLRDMHNQQHRVNDVNFAAEAFGNTENTEFSHGLEKLGEVNEKWNNLKTLAGIRKEKLYGAQQVQRLNHEISETLVWMKEKNAIVSNEENGRDSASVSQLQRKHEGVLRDLAAVEMKIEQLKQESMKVAGNHQDHSKEIQERLSQVLDAWDSLKVGAKNRKEDLARSRDLFQFVEDHREMSSWISDMQAILAADTSAIDVADAESLLEQHLELKGEIRARENLLTRVSSLGKELIELNVPEKEEIRNKLEKLANDDEALRVLWRNKCNFYEQLLELQLFYRDCEQAGTWMSRQETFLANSVDGKSLEEVEQLLKKHQDFERSIMSHEKKVRNIEDLFNKLLQNNHPASEEIVQQRNSILERRQRILDLSQKRLAQLNRSLQYESFFCDCTDLQSWIETKIESLRLSAEHKSDSNLIGLRAKLQRHSNCEQEVKANENRLESVRVEGKKLLKDNDDHSADVRRRIEQLEAKWNDLLSLFAEIRTKLQETEDEELFLQKTEDFLKWLESFESKVSSKYVGENVEAVKSLQKELNIISCDYEEYAGRLSFLDSLAEQMAKKNHSGIFDLVEKLKISRERYENSFLLLERRKALLDESSDVIHAIHEIDEELAWIDEKLSLARVKSNCSDPAAAPRLLKKQQALGAEIKSHEGQIEYVLRNADEKLNKGTMQNQLRGKATKLSEGWKQLKKEVEDGYNVLKNLFETHLFLSDAKEAEVWLLEKEPAILSKELGKDEDSAEILLKKHRALFSDLIAFKGKIESLRDRAERCDTHDFSGREYVVALVDYRASSPNEVSFEKGAIFPVINSSDKDWWKVESNGRQGFVPSGHVKRVELGREQDLMHDIVHTQKSIEKRYDVLIKLAEERNKKLDDAWKAFQLLREAENLTEWIDRAESATSQHIASDFDQVDFVTKKFDVFKGDLKEHEEKLKRMNDLAGAIICMRKSETTSRIKSRIEELNLRWRHLEETSMQREQQIDAVKIIQRFYTDVEEVMDRIREKLDVLNSDDVGRDILSVQALQKRHEGVEHELDALNEKRARLDDIANLLRKSHPEAAQHIYDLQRELSERWDQLVIRANFRKGLLLDAHDYHRFLSEYRDLLQWITSMNQLVLKNELATDVTGAEALLETHNEYRLEIDARAPAFLSFDQFGHQLISNKHSETPIISERLNKMNDFRNQLEDAWLQRRQVLEQCLELQFFNRDWEKEKCWIRARDAILERESQGTENLKAVQKKNEELRKALLAEEEKIKRLTSMADTLVSERHYDSENVALKRDDVISSWNNLKRRFNESQKELGESQTVQQINDDAEEMERWIADKFEIALEDNFYGSNIRQNYEKQQAFEAELRANHKRVQTFLEDARNSVSKWKKDDPVDEKLSDLSKKWNKLNKVTAEKTLRMKEANDQKHFLENVQDLEFWLDDVESTLQSDMFGNDLASVRSLLSKLQAVEADIALHEDNLLEVEDMYQNLVQSYNKGESKELGLHQKEIKNRFEVVRQMASRKRAVLSENLNIYLFLRDIDEEKAWMQEKIILTDNEDYGRDMQGVHNLRRKHRRIENEISNHEPHLIQLRHRGQELVQSTSNSDSDAGIKKKMTELTETLEQLLFKVEERHKSLDESEAFHQFLLDAGEEEAWMNENRLVLQSENLSEKMTGTQSLVKKHENFLCDLDVHRKRILNLVNSGKELTNGQNRHSTKIRRHCEMLKSRLAEIEVLADSRLRRLRENSAFLQFMWKCDTVDTWISEKEELVKLDEDIKDISRVELILAKQKTFNAGLYAFHKEGIERIGELRDQLLANEHQKKDLIDKRYSGVVQRWENLLKKSEERLRKLLELRQSFEKIEGLYLNFAKMASAFNSWIENAEEDLTDPVQCNSLQDVLILCDSYARSQSNFEKAEQELKELQKLDRLIKSLHVAPTPYTWFTVEALEENWRNLKQTNKEREKELVQERMRQEENEQLRKDFAKLANDFDSWLSLTRQHMMDFGGSLEEQLEEMKRKSEEILSNKAKLKKIENLGAILEKQLILDNRYTEHSTVATSQAWDQIHQLSLRMQYNLEQQIQARNQSGVKEESLREFTLMFKHFDRTKSGRLDYQMLKNCLRALGFDLEIEDGKQDPEFEKILNFVDPNRDGSVTLQDFMSFMVREETENVQSTEDIRLAFRALTKDLKPFITSEELHSVLTPQQAEFCTRRMKTYVDSAGRPIPGALDYSQFVDVVFN
ncbi:unnamed protein product [Caenorhabditis auriculariae]|uniref:Uncharacterized protein n=1 Tax=Caenorhabditis auriculariae TaxID=2777116 RepID=A0A8S1GYE0_9PELO|nr:unnamed protein product [Caenorhabditis auriculariae]